MRTSTFSKLRHSAIKRRERASHDNVVENKMNNPSQTAPFSAVSAPAPSVCAVLGKDAGCLQVDKNEKDCSHIYTADYILTLRVGRNWPFGERSAPGQYFLYTIPLILRQ